MRAKQNQKHLVKLGLSGLGMEGKKHRRRWKILLERHQEAHNFLDEVLSYLIIFIIIVIVRGSLTIDSTSFNKLSHAFQSSFTIVLNNLGIICHFFKYLLRTLNLYRMSLTNEYIHHIKMQILSKQSNLL